MANAAIYARKSTDQTVADQEKSVTRQVELAVACARTHGFEVPPEHIYVDDAISGAEFDRRPGRSALARRTRDPRGRSGDRPTHFQPGGRGHRAADDRAGAERRGCTLTAGSCRSPSLLGTIKRPLGPLQLALQG